MGPADLSPPRHDPLVRAEPVAADDLTVSLPKKARATSPQRCLAMVKTVKGGVTVAHNQTFLRSSRHDVSSMFVALA